MFKNVKEIKRKTTNKEVILTADRNIFANMILIAEKRNLNMKEVFSHPLGPLPWSLANPDGSLKKKNKSTLANFLESKISPSDQLVGESVVVIDAMAIIQKLHGENHTFDEISDLALFQVLKAGKGSKRIDVVFDTYKNNSIKTAERVYRGADEGIHFHALKSGHRVQNWRRLLRSSESKNKLTKFLVESWQGETKRLNLKEKILFVTYENKCLKMTVDSFEEVPELASSHEEADTRMMLHIRHASQYFDNIICDAEDTDVLILCAYTSLDIVNKSNIYVKRGRKSRIRLIDVRKLVSVLGFSAIKALPSLHAMTGCDTVSAMAGQGKLKALKMMLRDEEFKLLFSSLGNEWTVNPELFNILQKFISQLYVSNKHMKKVNETCYQLFRSRQGGVASVHLPPCEDCLYQHALRANYQSAIWKRCLANFPEIPNPANYGWTIDNSEKLSVKWMAGSPAPEVVLDLLSCSCSRSCKLPRCSCLLNKLKCTPACKLSCCENMPDPDTEKDCCDDEEVDDESEYLESEDER